jgi:methyl-accepting chemotaxis protein
VGHILAETGGYSLPHCAEFSFGPVSLHTTIDRLRSPTGEAVGYLITFDDVSELKREEHRAEVLQEQLASAAVAIEQLNLSITEISVNAAQASTLAADAEREASRISAYAADLDSRRAEIDSAVDSIDAVASLTQLLALNATIEAARAGDTGKGFAVVASEVKDLATETAKVTAEIGSKLKENGEAIGRLRADLEAMGEQMEQINSYQTGIAGAVEQQQAVSQSLALSILS